MKKKTKKLKIVQKGRADRAHTTKIIPNKKRKLLEKYSKKDESI